jgi:hypothetical protein
MYLHPLGASGSTFDLSVGGTGMGAQTVNPDLMHDDTRWATGRGYAGFDSPPPPSTPERSTLSEEFTIEDLPDDPNDKYVVVTAAILQQAEAEWRAELDLKGLPAPDHTVRQDSETVCDYCTQVARRAVTILLDQRDDKAQN